MTRGHFPNESGIYSGYRGPVNGCVSGVFPSTPACRLPAPHRLTDWIGVGIGSWVGVRVEVAAMAGRLAASRLVLKDRQQQVGLLQGLNLDVQMIFMMMSSILLSIYIEYVPCFGWGHLVTIVLRLWWSQPTMRDFWTLKNTLKNTDAGAELVSA